MTVSFIHGTTLVHPKIRVWGGMKKAERSDIRIGTDGSIPNAKVLDIGQKKIFPPKALDPLHRHRKSVERTCLMAGTKFMGGYAVSDAHLDLIIKKLDITVEKFDDDLKDFIKNYDDNRRSWLAEHSDYESILNQAPSAAEIESRFQCSYKLFKLNPIDGFEPDEEEMADQVIHEIAQLSGGICNALVKRTQAIQGQALLNRLQPVIDKLDALSFGNGRLLALLNEFESIASTINPMVKLESNDSLVVGVITFLATVSDPQRIESVLAGDFSASSHLNSNSTTDTPDGSSDSSSSTSTDSYEPGYF